MAVSVTAVTARTVVLVTARVGLAAEVTAFAAAMTTARAPPICKTRVHCLFLLAGAMSSQRGFETRGRNCLAHVQD
jgi:hypothetical protein